MSLIASFVAFSFSSNEHEKNASTDIGFIGFTSELNYYVIMVVFYIISIKFIRILWIYIF
jgi:hypothetical protein